VTRRRLALLLLAADLALAIPACAEAKLPFCPCDDARCAVLSVPWTGAGPSRVGCRCGWVRGRLGGRPVRAAAASMGDQRPLIGHCRTFYITLMNNLRHRAPWPLRAAVSRQLAAREPGVRCHIRRELGEVGRVELLRAVAERQLRVLGNLDDDAVGADRGGGA
jgi:hypothetical protein